MGEHNGEVGREFIEKIGCLLEGNNGFHVFQTCYEAPDAATVQVGVEKVRFDMIIDQTISDNPINLHRRKSHFFCECKWRTNNADLKNQLKTFLQKSIQTMPQLQRQYGDNFGYIFITNKPFDVDPNALKDTGFLATLLDEQVDLGLLTQLSNKIGMVLLTDWFLERITEGKRQ